MSTSHRLIRLTRTVVVALAAQFLLGIWVNLFGSFPRTRDLVVALAYGGDPVLTAHYALAAILVALGSAILVGSMHPTASRALRWMALGGLLSILWASASGIAFVESGFADNLESFSMAVAFIAATTFYGVAQAVMGPEALSGRPQDAPGGSAR